ncbi:GAF domain-containing protein [Leucobacter sp. 1207-22]|uniref:GAF domain-containing protein n=1 Tax=Leucobacter sp. 1207-22 TaxID=2604456 RepID=UPI004063C38B
MSNVWRALRRGESVRDRRRVLEQAHEDFVTGRHGVTRAELHARHASLAMLRPVVLDSWLRTRGTDPDRVPCAEALSAEHLEQLQRTHPLRQAMPVVRRLLLEEATESGFIVALGDAAGRLLWVEGDRELRGKAADIGFRPGMDWSESEVGMSAPGSALALDHGIQVLGAEHYSRAVHEWSCTAAPVHCPSTGAIIGVLDVTGGDLAASPHVLPLVKATLAAVEAELAVGALKAAIQREGKGNRVVRHSTPPAVPRLMVLGRDPALLELSAGAVPLSQRHAEILVALATEPAGLGAADLAERVYGAAEFEGTLRPELVRLRKWLTAQNTGVQILARPYRLSGSLRVDAVEALEAIARGAHRLAFAAYEGPVLPGSDAPVAEELRRDVDGTLREALLQQATPDLLFDYALRWGTEDVEVWQTLLQVLPPQSPRRARVVARLESLRP